MFADWVSWPFQAQESSCLRVRAKVILACSGALAWGRPPAHLSGYSVLCWAGCRNNMDAVAASARHPRGRLG